MISVYKMGMSYYAGKVDKNSGMTEFGMIVDELSDIETDKNVLVIINGIRDEEDNKLLDTIKKYDLSIFIMSDSIALETSLDIMNACDYVLHQSPYNSFKEIKTNQFYSFVPELFYKYCRNLIQENKIKVDKIRQKDVYFGGNNKNRDDKFKAYKVGESSEIFSRCKLYETGEDTRIGHNEYLQELSQFYYSLVICREDYRKIGWITSRYFEAIAFDNVPFIDCDYDIDNFIVDEESVLRVSDYDSLMEAREYLLKNPKYELNILEELKKDAEKKVDTFKKLIRSILE